MGPMGFGFLRTFHLLKKIIVNRNHTLKGLSVIFLTICLTSIASAQSEKYPYRSDYPAINTIETNDLKVGLDSGEYIVVDARSQLEYDVIHVDGAKHLAVSKKTFITGIKDIAASNPGKKIAFYCNGITCLKSYKAAQKAKEAGIQDVYAYDAGIPEWANMYPQETRLLGKAITDPEKQLLTKAQFKERTLAWSYFESAAGSDNVMVIDLRDKYQSTSSLPGMESARKIPLDVFIPNFVAKKANQDKTLLIFDQVGKQVKWLQYYLEEYGYDNYMFLEGGATSVLKKQDYRS